MTVDEVVALLALCVEWATGDPAGTLDREPAIDNAARLAKAVQQARSALALVDDLLAEFLLDTAGTGRHEAFGAPFEVRVGQNRKTWQHERVVSDLVPAIADQLPYQGAVSEDGERVALVDVVSGVVAAFRQASSDGWKVTGLRAYGLDPDDYAETSRGRVSVQFL